MKAGTKVRDDRKGIAGYAIGGVLLATIFLATCVNFGSGPTDRTVYYIDDENVYYSPPLMARDTRPFAFAMIVEDAVAEGFQPFDKGIANQSNYEALVFAVPKSMKWVTRRQARGHILVTTTTREELREIGGRRPDPKHREQGGFQDWCGPIIWAFRHAGFVKPRFGPDGEWNW